MDEKKPEGSLKKNVVRVCRLKVEPDVRPALAKAGVSLDELVGRHRAGDWGMTDDDWEAEHLDEAARRGGTVTSVYWIEPGEFVWITTEGQTTYVILAPSLRRDNAKNT